MSDCSVAVSSGTNLGIRIAGIGLAAARDRLDDATASGFFRVLTNGSFGGSSQADLRPAHALPSRPRILDSVGSGQAEPKTSHLSLSRGRGAEKMSVCAEQAPLSESQQTLSEQLLGWRTCWNSCCKRSIYRIPRNQQQH